MGGKEKKEKKDKDSTGLSIEADSKHGWLAWLAQWSLRLVALEGSNSSYSDSLGSENQNDSLGILTVSARPTPSRSEPFVGPVVFPRLDTCQVNSQSSANMGGKHVNGYEGLPPLWAGSLQFRGSRDFV